MNLQKMMKQAQEMQVKMQEMQAQLEASEVDGSAGGGAVKVRINGKHRALKVEIDPGLLEVSEKETLEDLLVVAWNDACANLEEMSSAQMKSLSAGLNLPPGMKLPF